MKITVFGGGAWGTAIAVYCDRIGHDVILVPRFEDQAELINKHRENVDFLPGVPLPDGLKVTADHHIGFEHCDLAFIGCPSKGLVDLCNTLNDEAKKSGEYPFLLSLCKGIQFENRDDLETPTQTIQRLAPGFEVGVFAGPTNAKEVAVGRHAGMVLATKSERVIELQHALNSKQIRVYRSNDLFGVELGGCLKNVYAICAGICDSMNLGDNAKAGYLTRAFREMVIIATELGAAMDTMLGLSGLGDFILTCTGEWSRNRTFGERIGKGEKVDDILNAQKASVEGYKTTKSLRDMCNDEGIDAPILNELYEVLYEGKEVENAFETLLGRDIKAEK